SNSIKDFKKNNSDFIEKLMHNLGHNTITDKNIIIMSSSMFKKYIKNGNYEPTIEIEKELIGTTEEEIMDWIWERNIESNKFELLQISAYRGDTYSFKHYINYFLGNSKNIQSIIFLLVDIKNDILLEILDNLLNEPITLSREISFYCLISSVTVTISNGRQTDVYFIYEKFGKNIRYDENALEMIKKIDLQQLFVVDDLYNFVHKFTKCDSGADIDDFYNCAIVNCALLYEESIKNYVLDNNYCILEGSYLSGRMKLDSFIREILPPLDETYNNNYLNLIITGNYYALHKLLEMEYIATNNILVSFDKINDDYYRLESRFFEKVPKTLNLLIDKLSLSDNQIATFLHSIMNFLFRSDNNFRLSRISSNDYFYDIYQIIDKLVALGGIIPKNHKAIVYLKPQLFFDYVSSNQDYIVSFDEEKRSLIFREMSIIKFIWENRNIDYTKDELLLLIIGQGYENHNREIIDYYRNLFITNQEDEIIYVFHIIHSHHLRLIGQFADYLNNNIVWGPMFRFFYRIFSGNRTTFGMQIDENIFALDNVKQFCENILEKYNRTMSMQDYKDCYLMIESFLESLEQL
ncbi:MAG: hypothetical protein H0X03_09085, partial [Nitrosopumilus sp.]|nr:hypothetical protein [Nitrosopumilus sp.]